MAMGQVVKKMPEAKSSGVDNVPLVLRGNTYVTTKASASLLKDIGGGKSIHELTKKFYEHFVEDPQLVKFMMDPSEPHAERLADWIIEKMGGEGPVWTTSRPPDARQISHFKAWNSSKREPEKRGDHFKLADCRIWMRLMFWAVREVGLAEHKPFLTWYLAFIAHFVAVYERRAPPFAMESFQWSQDTANIEMYIANGRKMHL